MRNPKILIIDEEASFSLFRQVTSDKGIGLLRAATVFDGLAAFREHHPDVVVLNLGLGEGSGLDAFRIIRKHDKVSPIIVIAAQGAIETDIEAMEGIFDYLIKPVDLDHLAQLIDRALRSAWREEVGPMVAECLPGPVHQQEPDATGVCLDIQRLLDSLQSEGSLYSRLIQEFDCVVLGEIMRKAGGNQTRASEMLGIDRKTLRAKLRNLGLAPSGIPLTESDSVVSRIRRS